MKLLFLACLASILVVTTPLASFDQCVYTQSSTCTSTSALIKPMSVQERIDITLRMLAAQVQKRKFGIIDPILDLSDTKNSDGFAQSHRDVVWRDWTGEEICSKSDGIEHVSSHFNPILTFSKHGQTELHIAASVGTSEVIELLLKCGVNFEVKDASGWTPLCYAVQANRPDVVRLLLEHKDACNKQSAQLIDTQYDIINERTQITDSRNREKLTSPFQIACREQRMACIEAFLDHNPTLLDSSAKRGELLATALLQNDQIPDRIDLIKWLIEAQADVNLPVKVNDYKVKKTIDGQDWSVLPINLAASTSNVLLVNQIVEAKAQVNPIGLDFQRTPLAVAASVDAHEVVRYLIDNQADISMRDAMGNTALSYACSNITRDMLKYGIEDTVDWHEEESSAIKESVSCMAPSTELAQAVQRNDRVLVERLLSKRANPNEFDEHGNTALFFASDTDIALRLLLADFDPLSAINHKNDNGDTPLLAMLKDDRIDCAFFLIMQNANLEIADSFGDYPVHIIARNPRACYLFDLLGRCNVLNQRNTISGDTPLHTAIRACNLLGISTLLSAGADREIRNNNEESPLKLLATSNDQNFLYKAMVLFVDNNQKEPSSEFFEVFEDFKKIIGQYESFSGVNAILLPSATLFCVRNESDSAFDSDEEYSNSDGSFVDLESDDESSNSDQMVE